MATFVDVSDRRVEDHDKYIQRDQHHAVRVTHEENGAQGFVNLDQLFEGEFAEQHVEEGLLGLEGGSVSDEEVAEEEIGHGDEACLEHDKHHRERDQVVATGHQYIAEHRNLFVEVEDLEQSDGGHETDESHDDQVDLEAKLITKKTGF